ncbi:MAG TPA: alpha/beta hydrolase [Baekduia sp.]|nr:alpha/beta hydrolase [Baekduia sp.]
MPTIELRGTTLNVEEGGPRDAPALLLSHSLFFDHRMFDPLTRLLTDRFRVVRYDHRGQGASARAPREELDMDTLADDAAALIQELGLGRCTVLGNSMGGFVALRLAARRPDLVGAAIVAGSAAGSEERIAEFDPLVQSLGEGGVEPVLDVVTHIMVGDTTMAEPSRAPLLAAVRDQLAALGPDIADAAWQVVHRRGVEDELASIRVPLLVLAGAEDHAYTVAQSRAIAEAVPGARLEIVERVGHSVALEDPETVAELIVEFEHAMATA